MVLRVVAGVQTGEDSEDLRSFLSRIEGGAPIHETLVLACDNHDDERPTWTYVEADAAAGVARRRCLQCAKVTPMLDSADRWTHPMTWACGSCHQSIAEVAVGLSLEEAGTVGWLVAAARCVECGRIDGLTDMVLPHLPLSDVLGGL